MKIIERITQLLSEKNKLAVDLCKSLGIQTSTMSTWKTQNSDPPACYMPTIARFLGVSLDYLITGEDAPAKRYTTEDEDRLLELYRTLPDSYKHEFLGELKGFLRAVSDDQKYLDAEKRLSV